MDGPRAAQKSELAEVIDLTSEKSPQPVLLGRRELTALIFGPYPKAEPIKCQGKAGEILERIFPFHFPIWELDHS